MPIHRDSCASTLRRGAAAVEFAIALPLLLLLVLGCVDLGRVAKTSIVVNNAVAAGASWASAHRLTQHNRSAWEAAVRQAMLQEMQDLRSLDETALELTINTQSNSAGETIVAISAHYPFTFVVTWPGLPGNFTIRQTTSCVQYR